MSTDDIPVDVRSIFGANTQRGLVELTVGDQKLTLSPAKAREVASFLVEAATSAEGDEVLMKVLDRAGMSRARAAHVLMAMRQERAILERKARQEARQAIAYDQSQPDLPE
jgi:hypothetical protein